MKIVAAALLSAVLLSGCAYPDWQNLIAKVPHRESQNTGQDGPWSEHIAEEHHLTDCQSAEQSYKIAIALDIKFQSLLDSPTVPQEVKTVVSAEQAGLWQLENDLILWHNTNCKKA